MVVTAESVTHHKPGSCLSVGIASSEKEVNECLKLRYQVFAKEMGAKIRSPDANDPVGRDEYDTWCRHIRVTDNYTGKIVATTRLLSSSDIRFTGNFYAETEFDISCLLTRDLKLMEIGRTCVDAEYRDSEVLSLIWSTIESIAAGERIDYVMGCASFPLSAGDGYISTMMQQLHRYHFSSDMFRVRPLVPLRLVTYEYTDEVTLPALLGTCIKLGAVVCGDPYWDASSCMADVFFLLDVEKMAHHNNKIV